MGDRFVALWCSVKREVEGQEGRVTVEGVKEEGKSDMVSRARGEEGDEGREEEAGDLKRVARGESRRWCWLTDAGPSPGVHMTPY